MDTAGQLLSRIKRCSKCNLEKPFEQFHKTKRGKYGLAAWCKDCMLQQSLTWAQNNRQRIYLNGLKYKYNLTIMEYEALLERQNHSCAICSTAIANLEAPICVDHDHATGQVRGLLCRKCNAALGFFCDDVALVKKAVQYLEGVEWIPQAL